MLVIINLNVLIMESLEFENLTIKDIVPDKAGDDTLTPGRKFLQVIFEPLPEEGFLNTERIASRNFWMEFFDGRREDGAALNIAADQLFLSICKHCGINAENIENIPWEPGSEIFRRAVGMKVKGAIVKEYVKEYHINDSLSKDNTRFTYTTIILKGEDVPGVFRNQGHVIIQDPKELETVKKRLAELSHENEMAREQRQHDRGIATVGERTGTGVIAKEKSLAGFGTPSVESHQDPAMNRDPQRGRTEPEKPKGRGKGKDKEDEEVRN
jgi:hypothetical protein